MLEIPPPYNRQVATASADKTIKLWSINNNGGGSGQSLSLPATPSSVRGGGGGGGAEEASSSSSSSNGSGMAVKLFKTLAGHSRWVWDLAYSADTVYLISASSDHSARLWEVNRGETIRQYTGHQRPVVCLALNDQP